MSWLLINSVLFLFYLALPAKRRSLGLLIAAMNAVYVINHLCHISIELYYILSFGTQGIDMVMNSLGGYTIPFVMGLLFPFFFLFRKLRIHLGFTFFIMLISILMDDRISIYLAIYLRSGHLPSPFNYGVELYTLGFWLETLIWLGAGILLHGVRLLPEHRRTI